LLAVPVKARIITRRRFGSDDRYAFYLAYDGHCGYCNRPLDFRDFEIDHIVPWHLARDPVQWRRVLNEYGLSSDFDVEGDGNLMAVCRSCNSSKTGDQLDPLQAVLPLKKAGNKAPRVASFRKDKVAIRRRQAALATITKAATDDPSFRDQVMGTLTAQIPTPSVALPSPWPDDRASELVRKIFGAASRDLLTWPQVTDGKWIERPELALLQEAIESKQDGRAIALVGPRGCGKSSLLARLGAGLIDGGHVLLAIKADMLPRRIASILDLDREWGLAESLPLVLERLACEVPVVLLIDQLDALTPLMDAHSERLFAMLSLISRVLEIPNTVVIISCRSFDADHDMRLSNLIQPAARISLNDPPWEQIQPLLTDRGFQPANWAQSVKHLLSRPQHLRMFLRHFSPNRERPALVSLQAMLETILQNVVDVCGAGAADALEAITEEMRSSEELWVPLGRFQPRFSDEIHRLQQSDLIQLDPSGLRIGFTHQTFYEFLSGRAFAIRDLSLIEEVRAKQDGLQIRALLWSAINYMRAANPARCSEELGLLFGSPDIRLHIKLLLVDFLGTVCDPTPEEAGFFKAQLAHSEVRPHVLAAIAKKPTWFALLRDAVASRGFEDAGSAWEASFVLGPALCFEREFVISTLEASWLNRPELDAATFNVFHDCEIWDERSARIVEKLIGRMEVAAMWVCHVAQLMGKTRPDLAARLVRRKLDIDLARARSEIGAPLQRPDASASVEEQVKYHLEVDGWLKPVQDLVSAHGDWYELEELAKTAPAELVEAVWPWVEETALCLSEPARNGFRTDHDWNLGASTHSTSYLARAIWDAVSAFARTQPERFLGWVGVASSSEALSVHQLIVHALIEIAPERPAAAVDYLLGETRRLAIRSHFGTESATRDLMKAASAALSRDQTHRLVRHIESWEPHGLAQLDEEQRVERERWNDLDRLDLLSALPSEYLSLGIRERIAELPERRDHNKAEGGLLEPPKKSEDMERMTDWELLSFLKGWPDGREGGLGGQLGGTYAVASQFATFAGRNPERAMSIMRKLQPGEQETPAGAALQALASLTDLDAEPVRQLSHDLLAAGFASEGFRSCFAWALVSLSQRGNGLNDESIRDLQLILREPIPREKPESSQAPWLPTDRKGREEKSVLWDRRGRAARWQLPSPRCSCTWSTPTGTVGATALVGCSHESGGNSGGSGRLAGLSTSFAIPRRMRAGPIVRSNTAPLYEASISPDDH
jgi:5-methylcytosine-specific restriction endonuclease McrA